MGLDIKCPTQHSRGTAQKRAAPQFDVGRQGKQMRTELNNTALVGASKSAEKAFQAVGDQKFAHVPATKKNCVGNGRCHSLRFLSSRHRIRGVRARRPCSSALDGRYLL